MLKRIARRLLGRRGAVPVALAPRDEGLRAEIAFWRDWFVGQGLEWPDDYKRRFDAALQLQPELAKFVPLVPRDVVDLIDVGAGPVTRLGKKIDGKTLRLVATDLLAEDYNRLIDELKVEPLVRTRQADAERLVEQFGPASFDIVHAQNTVDHMERPLVAIDQMIELARPGGGVVYLRHEENEGKRANYATLHHWDFFLDDATHHFVIQHANGDRFDVTELTADRGTSTSYREGHRVVFEFTKH